LVVEHGLKEADLLKFKRSPVCSTGLHSSP
jgi:hypothetical protein